MKKVIMIAVGGLLFIAAYKHTRRQAEYVATQNAAVKSLSAKAPAVTSYKMLPTFAFQSDKSFLSSN